MQHDPGRESLALARAVAGAVEHLGRLGVCVVVKKPIQCGEGVGVGLAGLPRRRRDGNSEGGGLPTAKAHVQVDLVALGEVG